MTDRGKAPPTLHRLIVDAEFCDRLLRGDYQDGRRSWSCVACGGDHPAIAECPDMWRGCFGRHPASEYCVRLRQLEQREKDEADREKDEAERRSELESDAAAEGVTVGELSARREAEGKQKLRDTLDRFRRGAGPREAA